MWKRGVHHAHSGRGNFKDIDVEDLTKHRMDSEEMIVDGDLVDQINAAKRPRITRLRRRHVGAARIGKLRMHERTHHALHRMDQQVHLPSLRLFRMHFDDFQLPYALLTMLMMAAFGGYDLIMKAYDVAIKREIQVRSLRRRSTRDTQMTQKTPQ